MFFLLVINLLTTEFEASENNEDIAKAACFQNKEKSDKDKKKEKSIKKFW